VTTRAAGRTLQCNIQRASGQQRYHQILHHVLILQCMAHRCPKAAVEFEIDGPS
jgi:hypothetical protein